MAIAIHSEGSRVLAQRVSKAARQFAWSLLVPGVMAVVALRALTPSRIEAGSDGGWGLAAWLGDEHPMLALIALFMLSSAAVRYWRERAGPAVIPGVAPAVALSAGASARAWARSSLVVAAVILSAAFLRLEVADVHRVASPAMIPTLERGDRVLVDKLAYGITFGGRRLAAREPKRGDVVLVSAPSGQEQTSFRQGSLVGRIIGRPGDYVSFQVGHPIINNWMVPSCDAGPFATAVGAVQIKGRLTVEFLEGTAYLTVRTPAAEPLPGYRVLPGEVFVIGDDRGISSDPRAWNAGPGTQVPIGSIVGRVSRIVAGGRRDGSADLHELLAPLAPRLRESGLDLRETEQRIAACIKEAPAAARPPMPGG